MLVCCGVTELMYVEIYGFQGQVSVLMADNLFLCDKGYLQMKKDQFIQK